MWDAYNKMTVELLAAPPPQKKKKKKKKKKMHNFQTTEIQQEEN